MYQNHQTKRKLTEFTILYKSEAKIMELCRKANAMAFNVSKITKRK